MKYEQNLEIIAQYEQQREDENLHFRTFLKTAVDTAILDEIVHPINEQVTAAIDCTQCGNCCRSLMIHVTKADADRAAHHLKMTSENFTDKFIEKGAEAENNTEDEGTMLMNTIPCHFLTDNKCTIYEARFDECRDFPHIQ